MNKGKGGSGAKLKEDMFKNDSLLNIIFTDLINKTNAITTKFQEDLLSFQVTKINQGYLGNLFLIGGSGTISSVANITVENRIFTLTVHDKSKISTVRQTIEKSRNLAVSSSGNILSVTIPDPTEERREKVIKEMHEHSTNYIDQINSARTKANDELKKIETAQKQNSKKKDKDKDASSVAGVSEDDLKKAKELVEQIKNDRLAKLKAMLDKQESDIRNGSK